MSEGVPDLVIGLEGIAAHFIAKYYPCTHHKLRIGSSYAMALLNNQSVMAVAKLQFLLVLVGSFLLASEAIHLKKHLAIDTYVSLLRQSQTDIKDLAANLQQSIKSILSQVGSQETVEAKISLVENAIAGQKASISKLQELLKAPLNQSGLKCGQITPDEQLLIGDAPELQKTMSNLNDAVNNLSDTSQNTGIHNQVYQANQQLNSISNTLSSPLSAAAQANTTFLTNLIAGKWVLGKLSQQQLSQKYDITSQGIFLTCPIDKPYANAKDSCISCPTDEYFNLSTKLCVKCKHFNQQSRKCEDTWGINLNTGVSRLILPNGTDLASLAADVMCPEDTPFYNGTDCINCGKEGSTLFRYENKTCSSCLANEEYVEKDHSCNRKQVKVSNLEGQVSISRMIFPNGQEGLQAEKNRQTELRKLYNVSSCPLATPYYVNSTKQCISCAEDKVFSFNTSECTSCPDKTFHNASLLQCQQIVLYSALNTQLWTSDKKSQTQWLADTAALQGKTGYEQCPSDSPFYNGQKCIRCQDGQIFNLDTLNCFTCAKDKEYYSLNLRRCVQISAINAQTNPSTASNLVYDGYNNNRWMYIYYGNLVRDPDVVDCPKESPFWDYNSCITCPQDRPYFNLAYQVCQHCFQQSSYDASKKQCVDEQGSIVPQSPIIETLQEYQLSREKKQAIDKMLEIK